MTSLENDIALALLKLLYECGKISGEIYSLSRSRLIKKSEEDKTL